MFSHTFPGQVMRLGTGTEVGKTLVVRESWCSPSERWIWWIVIPGEGMAGVPGTFVTLQLATVGGQVGPEDSA